VEMFREIYDLKKKILVIFGPPSYGTSSDCNIFKNSNFCKKLEGKHLNIPGSRPLPNDNNGTPMPFVIVGDEVFALSQHVL